MKKAISLLLLAVLITSLTLVHQGEVVYGAEYEDEGKVKKQYPVNRQIYPREEQESKEYPREEKSYDKYPKQNKKNEYIKKEQNIYGKEKGVYQKEQYGEETKGYQFLLIFEHAARDALWNQDSNRFAVQFNGKIVREFLPRDYEIHKEKIRLQGRKGKNSLHFIGKGLSDTYGSQVDNIKLFRNKKNYIRNGGFEQGYWLETEWKIFKCGEYQGWLCKDEMEVGWGRIFNIRWPYLTHVCQLEANHNSDIFQTFDADRDGRPYSAQEYEPLPLP